VLCRTALASPEQTNNNNNNKNNKFNNKADRQQHNHYNNKITPTKTKQTNPLLLCGFVLGYLVVVVLCVAVDMFCC
jgi:hypothetical protein